ncbi:MAG: hypothetical protein CMJ78_09590 [Planctomycetaceae bacterium]|nr:hypothetical protein [Planctomycetaceae bacterium]
MKITFQTPLVLTIALSLVSQSFAQDQPVKTVANTQPGGVERTKSDADQAYRQGKYQRAIDLTTSVLRQNPQDHVALYLRASSKVELGQARGEAELVRQGIQDARQAVAAKGSDNISYYLPYLYGMTTLSQIEDRPNHAQVVVQVAGQLLGLESLRNSDAANIHYQRALAHMFLRDAKSAAKDYDSAIQKSPSHIAAYVGLAEAHSVNGDAVKAGQSFDRAVTAFPKNPTVFNNRGMFLQGQGKYDAAIGDFTQALQLDPKFFVAHTNRGFTLMESGDAQAAENEFSASLQINPQQPLVHSLRGTSRLTQGKLSDAVSDYKQVVRFDGRNPVAHADLGFALFFAGDHRSALASFDQAKQIDKEMRFIDPWRALALTLVGKGSDAQTRFASASKKASADRDWIDHLLSYQVGAISEEQLLAAISKDSNLKAAQQCEAHFFIAQRKASSGDAAGAQQQFKAAINTNAKQLSAYRGSQVALGQITSRN